MTIFTKPSTNQNEKCFYYLEEAGFNCLHIIQSNNRVHKEIRTCYHTLFKALHQQIQEQKTITILHKPSTFSFNLVLIKMRML